MYDYGRIHDKNTYGVWWRRRQINLIIPRKWPLHRERTRPCSCWIHANTKMNIDKINIRVQWIKRKVRCGRKYQWNEVRWVIDWSSRELVEFFTQLHPSSLALFNWTKLPTLHSHHKTIFFAIFLYIYYSILSSISLKLIFIMTERN